MNEQIYELKLFKMNNWRHSFINISNLEALKTFLFESVIKVLSVWMNALHQISKLKMVCDSQVILGASYYKVKPISPDSALVCFSVEIFCQLKLLRGGNYCTSHSGK